MRYDAVIVGAGIAGLYAAVALGRAGWRVCILERRARIGLPVRCAEATGNRAELGRFISVDEACIARTVAGLSVRIGPAFELTRRVPEAGLVLHRDRFEGALARTAQQLGAHIRLGCHATGLSRANEGRYRVELAGGEAVEGAVIVGADGPESSIGRWAGITRPLRLAEAFSAVQYRVTDRRYDDELLRFVVGREEIPQGYLWIFPKGEGRISVGAGIYGGRAAGREARYYLERFLERNFPSSEKHSLVSGCAPLAPMPRRPYRGNVVVVGDAARQVNPLTAGGIMNALEAADELCRHLGALPTPGGALDRAFASYAKVLRRDLRRQQKIFLLLQRVFLESTDEELQHSLMKADQTCGGLTDRSQPFRLPLGAALRGLLWLTPRAAKHWRVLLG